MEHSIENTAGRRVVVGLSGGVDSAVAAMLLRDAGADVHALHMTNWEDDDGYCDAAQDLQDARRICEWLDIPLHHVNFARQYRERVFASFLAEYQAGRTPNPDVLCNREIKFGVFHAHARRLGARFVATGHYARVAAAPDGGRRLLKGADTAKDQSYFLHAVRREALADVIFPVGELTKTTVRELAHERGLPVHDKKDSTGICFIGERPFREFLSSYLPARPGVIMTADGREVGRHVGLMFYTPGQRQGLGIGGRRDADDAPWYVVEKRLADNVLVVDQGDSPFLYCTALALGDPTWIGSPPTGLARGRRLAAKIRYRQPDQPCRLTARADGGLVVHFDEPQRAAAPGQYAVFYDDDVCFGGAVIDRIAERPAHAAAGGL